LLNNGAVVDMCLSCSIVAIRAQVIFFESVITETSGNSQTVIDFTHRINEAFLCSRNKGLYFSQQFVNNLRTRKVQVKLSP
jgi:hypothetical protein